MPIPRWLNRIFPIGLFAFSVSFLPVAYSADGTNSPAEIGGAFTAGVTEDLDPDGDGLLEVDRKLSITDEDPGEAAFKAGTQTGRYGTLKVTADGQCDYAASNSQAVIQALNAGDTLVDPFEVSSIDGTTHTLTIFIEGVDDDTNSPAEIGGAFTAGVTEDLDPDGDGLLEVDRKLSITDEDPGEAAFKAGTQTGLYGTMRITADGQCEYAASNNQAVIQALNAGDTLVDPFEVSSIDGTTHTLTIFIEGVDDDTNSPAEISGAVTAGVTEDLDPDGDGLLEVDRKLSITDEDPGEAAFKAGTQTGRYGTMRITADGQCEYAARNNQAVIQALNAGDRLEDPFEVSSIDGTTHTLTIFIEGVDDDTNSPAEISGAVTAGVTEDLDPDGDGLLEVDRKLSITDEDPGEAAFKAGTQTGRYGTMRITADGQCEYAASNSQAVIQALDAGDRLEDPFEISSIDGTTHTLTIFIEGVDDTSGRTKGIGNTTISWIAPAEREDGTAISMAEIAGYRVYYGTSQGNYTREVEINNSSTMSVTLSNLKPATYYIVITSFDWDGRESTFSDEVIKSII